MRPWKKLHQPIWKMLCVGSITFRHSATKKNRGKNGIDRKNLDKTLKICLFSWRFQGERKAVNAYGTGQSAAPAAATASASNDDDDIDLFGEEDEEESELTKQRLAAYAQKKAGSESKKNSKVSISWNNCFKLKSLCLWRRVPSFLM